MHKDNNSQRIPPPKTLIRIIILDDGKITEMGTHDELIAKGILLRGVQAAERWLRKGGGLNGKKPL